MHCCVGKTRFADEIATSVQATLAAYTDHPNLPKAGEWPNSHWLLQLYGVEHCPDQLLTDQ